MIINKPKGVSTRFHHMASFVSIDIMTINMFIIYRPPPSRQNGFKNSAFFTEWSAYLDELAVIIHDILIRGDITFHLDNIFSSDAKPLATFWSIMG